MLVQDIINKLQHFASFLPLIGLMLVGAVLLLFAIKAMLRLLEQYQLFKLKAVFLEITPPAFTDKTQQATAQLFSLLHGLSGAGSPMDRLLRRQNVFALEVVSSKSKGIRYILRVSEQEADSFQKTIASYLPETKIKQIKDYLPPDLDRKNTKVISFKQTGNFAFPLQPQTTLENHDPIAYLTGAMTKLEDDEIMAFQLVLRPAQIREASDIDNMILRNEDLLSELRGRKNSLRSSVFNVINKFLFAAVDAISTILSPQGHSSPSTGGSQRDHYDRMQVARNLKPARQLSAFEQELVTSIHHKVQQPLYYVSVRALVSTNSKAETKQRLKGVKASLTALSVPKYQSLKAQSDIFTRIFGRYSLVAFAHRLPEVIRKNSCILAVSEIADLYHFPHSSTTKTENVVKSLSRSLPAPVSLKNGSKMDILLGENHHHGSTTLIGLTESERERHVYIVGGTGNGKTTMLLYAMVQDINNGKGLAVIDPHGDLAETVLKHIPENRLDDVIYFNPDDIDYPLGINLLELPEGLSGNELLREKDRITETVVSVFRKIFSDDDSGGHRIEYILRNTVQTALCLENSTIFTIFRLLNSPKYRKQVVRDIDNQDLRDFWNNELSKAGEFQRVKMSAGITSKIGRFLFSASARRILEQPSSTIDFDDIINSGKVLICNFSKGLLGEDTSALFGITVLAKLQIATLRRARIQQAERTPFYLYADEFQNFATMSFVQLLSEARKYKLFLLMAEQSTSQQQEQRMVDIILANVGTVVCFRTGNPADEKLLLPMFAPFVEKGDIAYLPSFQFYIRIAAISSQEPFSGETTLLDNAGDARMAERVIEASRRKFGLSSQSPDKASDDNVEDVTQLNLHANTEMLPE